MNEYTPDRWVVVKIEGPDFPLHYKVFACWYGGFLGADSWKLNSGITKITKQDEFYLFEGYSGSVYKCHERSYGTHNYGAMVLLNIIKKSKEIETKVEMLSHDTNWLEIKYINEKTNTDSRF
jgi:hypothetical protein